MLQIDTSKYDKKRWHDVEIAGHHFRFRELGAGEMLGYSQKAERAYSLSSKKDKLTEKQALEAGRIMQDMIASSLSMFEDPSGGNNVAAVIGQYNALDLFDMVNQIREQLKNAPTEGN